MFLSSSLLTQRRYRLSFTKLPSYFCHGFKLWFPPLQSVSINFLSHNLCSLSVSSFFSAINKHSLWPKVNSLSEPSQCLKLTSPLLFCYFELSINVEYENYKVAEDLAMTPQHEFSWGMIVLLSWRQPRSWGNKCRGVPCAYGLLGHSGRLREPDLLEKYYRWCALGSDR